MHALTRGLRPYLILSLLCVGLYVPGIASMPVMDRDEARFAQATRQMLETGDYVFIRFQDEPRNKKPVGIHWLQAASVDVFSDPDSDAIWPYRLPSALGATLAVLLTFFYGARLFDRPTGLIGGAILAASLLLTVEAHLAKTDAMLLACVVAMAGTAGRFYAGARGGSPPAPWESLVFWIALGAGTLIKGPLMPTLAVLILGTFVVMDRSVRPVLTLRPALGMIVTAAIVAPWAVAVSQGGDGDGSGGSFFVEAFRGDILPKLIGGHESHGAPPGTYLLLVGATFWPGALFLWPAVLRVVRQRAEPGLAVLFAWIVPVWLLFELIPTKLPHYVMPTYPALALAVASLLLAVREPAQAWLWSRWMRIWYGVMALVTLALAALPVAAPLVIGDPVPHAAYIAAFAALAACVLGGYQLWHRRALNALAAPILLAIPIYGTIIMAVMPQLSSLWVARSVDRVLDTLPVAANAPIAAAGFHEPSLVFRRGTRTNLTDAAGAAAHLSQTPRAAAVIADDCPPGEPPRLENRKTFLEAARGQAAPAITFEGLNYSRGDRLCIAIFIAAESSR